MQTCKLHIGNLSFSCNDSMLREWLEGRGLNVQKVDVIMDHDTGHSKGFAFVTFLSEQSAGNLIASLDKQMMLGREISANLPRPKKTAGGTFRDQYTNRRSFGSQGGYFFCP
jgi:RNA recognition motif-containing protein